MQLVSLLPEIPARPRRSTPGIGIATPGIEIEIPQGIPAETGQMASATPYVTLDIQKISLPRFRRSCTRPRQTLH